MSNYTDTKLERLNEKMTERTNDGDYQAASKIKNRMKRMRSNVDSFDGW